MKDGTKPRVVPTRFGRPARFAVKLNLPAKLQQGQAVELEGLKDRLLQPLLGETEDPLLRQALRWAGRDAAALAWSASPYASLLFPVLLEEKVVEAREYARHQDRIRQRNQTIDRAA